jgi:hypothetical protein
MTAATKRTKKTKPFISIQERSRNKALNAYAEIDYAIDKYMDSGGKLKFSMYKYLVGLGYSSRVVQYMKGQCLPQLEELENKENCPQLKEGYSHLTAGQKRKFINFLKKIETDIEKYCDEYKPVRKIRVRTPAQLVKKLPYLKEYEGFKSIDPEDIPRSRMLYTYNTSTKKLSSFEGRLSVRGSKITGIDKSQERLLTDLALLGKLYKGGDIIARRFMETLKTKSKEANNRITKNTLLIKVVK